MLFNTLANLRSLMTIDPPRAQLMIDRLISFLRATLAASRHDAVPLAAEFDLLRDYLELIAIRMGPRLRSRCDLPPALRRRAGAAAVAAAAGGERRPPRTRARHRRRPHRRLCDRRRGYVVPRGRGYGRRLRRARASSGGGFGLEQVRERLRTAHGDAAGLVIESPRPMTAAGQAPGARLVLTMPRALSPAAKAPLIAPSRTTAQMPGPHPSGPYGSAPHGSGPHGSGPHGSGPHGRAGGRTSGLPGTAASPTATSR